MSRLLLPVVCRCALGSLAVAAPLRAAESVGPALVVAITPAAGSPAVVSAARTREQEAESNALSKPLFTAEYVSVYNEHGVYGFVPGSPVRLVRRETTGDWLTVTDGRFEVKVNSVQVTDDPAVAAGLRRQAAEEDRAAQAAQAARRSTQAKPSSRPDDPARAPAPSVRPPAPAVSAVRIAPLTAIPAPPQPLCPPPLPPAPAGTLFLCEYVSTSWAHGVAGFAPGQPVRLIGTDAATGKRIVTDGRFQVAVASTQLTSDPNYASALWQRDAAAQEFLREQNRVARLTFEQRERQFEEAKRRSQLVGDLAAEGLSLDGSWKAPPVSVGGQPSVYERRYGLRDDPYTAAHENIPRWSGPHSQPGSLGVGSHGLGFY